jgi:hypothetical protein
VVAFGQLYELIMYYLVFRNNSSSQKVMYKRGQKEEEGSHGRNNSTRIGIRERAE